MRGPLAQRAERRAFNPGVGGSSPSGPTRKIAESSSVFLDASAILLGVGERTPDAEGV